MPLRNAKPLTIRPAGLTDAIDGTNSPPGSMAALQDLVPNPSTRGQYVPRPASVSVSSFAGFTTPGKGQALLVIGNLAYGFIASARNAGKDEPFCYDLVAGAFITIGNITAANVPTTQAATGDWTPPQVAGVTTGRIMLTHPGYDGVTYFVGWIDISSFSYSGAITGATHSNKTVDGFASSVITLGWQVGYKITSSTGDIPADTYITNISADGKTVTISNNATGTNAGQTFTVTGGTPAAPVYGAGNTAPVALLARPAAVGQFNGRAYYGVGNQAVYSDSQLPTQISNASQALALGDNTAVTAFGGLPLTSQLSGGVIQALIAFKGAGEYFQITGDTATNNLAASAVAGSMGTLAPLSICSTSKGLAYMAQDGIRIIGQSGIASDPIGAYGQGVTVPFIQAVHPSRACAAYNHDIIRFSVINGAAQDDPLQEYWYDLNLNQWTGPHSFPADMITPWDGDAADTFIMFANGVSAKLFQSDPQPSANSTYTENGNAMSWVWQPTLFPDTDQMAGNAIVEASIALALPATSNITVLVFDETGAELDLLNFMGSTAGGGVWGSFNWGAAVWGSPSAPFQQYSINFHQKIVFKQASIRMAAMSVANQIIGNLYLNYQILGYLLK